MTNTLKAFGAGFLATIFFHQSLLGLFFLFNIIPNAPFNLNPVAPFGVPSLLSLSFFGGLWGPIIWRLVRQAIGKKQWALSIIYGAVGPTFVAYVLVFPLKGISLPLSTIPFGLLLNGFWGAGFLLFMKAFRA